MLIKLEDVVDLPPEPYHTQRIQFPYWSFGTPVLHAGVARLRGSKLGHGLSLQCLTARIAVHGIDTSLALKKIGSIKSEVGTELKPETLAVQCKVRRCYKSQIRQLKKQR